jgi:hypothetical protein
VTLAAQLKSAMHSGTLVRFNRPFEESPAEGYIVAVGPDFFLLALVSDHIRFNGFQAMRIVDVRRLRPHPFTAFVESALKKRRERRPKKPKVSVSSLRALLLSAQKSFPLVTIHRERIDPDVCQIGRVMRVTTATLSLLEITPGAVWEEAPTQHALKQITRVDFGGDFEDALHLVGGDPTG